MSARLRYSVPRLRGMVTRLETATVRALWGRHFGPGLRVYGLPVISVAPGSTLTVGARAVLVSVPEFSEPGVSHPCVLRTLAPGSRLIVGDDVGMSGCSLVAAREVAIGDRVLLGADAVVTDTDFHPLAAAGRRWSRHGVGSAPVVIGDDVFVGMRAVILKGVTVGRGAVVAAGSVVTSDVPAWAIVAGVPARVVGEVPDRPAADTAGDAERGDGDAADDA